MDNLNNSNNKEIDVSKVNQELIVALNFLELTKNGEYTNFDNDINEYSRLNTETFELEEYYFTSFS